MRVRMRDRRMTAVVVLSEAARRRCQNGWGRDCMGGMRRYGEVKASGVGHRWSQGSGIEGFIGGTLLMAWQRLVLSSLL